MPPVFLQPANWPMKVLKEPVVLARPAHKPAKKLFEPVVLARPAQKPAKKLLLPEVLHRPAQDPIKMLSVPDAPVPLRQLLMLRVPHWTNTELPPPPTAEPLTNMQPLPHTCKQFEPAFKKIVSDSELVPAYDPRIRLLQPVVINTPAQVPKKVLLAPVVHLPAHIPTNVCPALAVLARPEYLPMKIFPAPQLEYPPLLPIII